MPSVALATGRAALSASSAGRAMIMSGAPGRQRGKDALRRCGMAGPRVPARQDLRHAQVHLRHVGLGDGVIARRVGRCRRGRRSSRHAARRCRGSAGPRRRGAAWQGRRRSWPAPACDQATSSGRSSWVRPCCGRAWKRCSAAAQLPERASWSASTSCATGLSGSWCASCTASDRPLRTEARKACWSSSGSAGLAASAFRKSSVAVVGSDCDAAKRPTRKSARRRMGHNAAPGQRRSRWQWRRWPRGSAAAQAERSGKRDERGEARASEDAACA